MAIAKNLVDILRSRCYVQKFTSRLSPTAVSLQTIVTSTAAEKFGKTDPSFKEWGFVQSPNILENPSQRRLLSSGAGGLKKENEVQGMSATSTASGVADRGDGSSLISVEFEVYGQVQGVFFRKYTEKRAKELGLVGWVKNTKSGTVAGQFQGSKEAVSQMKDWLMHTGSPESSITKCDFKSEKNVSKAEYSTFEVRH